MSLFDRLSQFASWFGTVWRGEAYALLARQLEHERQEADKREQQLKDRVVYLEKQVEAHLDRILLIKGVPPVNTKIERKPLPQRKTPLEQAIDNGYKQHYGKSKADVDKIALARLWKAKNLPGTPDDVEDPTNLDPLDNELDEEVA
jgi:ABC-type phosphate transport system auxiliary subunit